MATMTMDSDPIILRYKMKHTSAQLWRALTEISIMRAWFFSELEEFKAEVGFKTEFTLTNEDRQFTHQWEVTEVNHLKSIIYDWTFAEYKGCSSSKFDILEDGLLQITVTVHESFPTGISEFEEESCRGGWNWLMDRLTSLTF